MHTIVDDGDAVVKYARVLIALPSRRRQAAIHRVESAEQMGVPGANAAPSVEVDAGFRNVVSILAFGAVEQFAIRQDRRAREDVAQEHGLAPAGVTDDEVGLETFPLKSQARARDSLAPPDGQLGSAEVAMGLRVGRLIELTSPVATGSETCWT